MQGIVSHDETVTSNVGTSPGTIDWMYTEQVKWMVDVSPPIRQLMTDDSTSLDFLSQPVADGPPVQEMKEDL